MEKPHRWMGVWVALALLGAGAVAVFAQDVPPLTGLVTANAAPKAGVTVTVFAVGGTDPLATATTGPDGRYRLVLPRGVYRIVFTGSGLEPVTRYGFVVLPDGTNELNVTMHPPMQSGEVPVSIETPLGTIVIAVDTVHAPITAANFLKYVDGGFYDGGRFHRATRPDNYTPAPPDRPMMEIIQGGINPDRRSDGFPAIALERTSVTGLKHVVGTVSMARGTGADTASSDFFILLDDQPSLDFGGKRFPDGQGGAAFGRVIAGLDVVRKIQQQPVNGQNLTPPVPILRSGRKK